MIEKGQFLCTLVYNHNIRHIVGVGDDIPYGRCMYALLIKWNQSQVRKRILSVSIQYGVLLYIYAFLISLENVEKTTLVWCPIIWLAYAPPVGYFRLSLYLPNREKKN
jgi:hypothetical protein